MKNLFFFLSIFQGFLTQAIGIYLVLKGSYKPQRMTRFIFFAVTAISVGAIYSQKNWDALGLAGAQLVGVSIMLLLSLKYGVGGFKKLDIVSLILASVTLVIWRVTDNPVLALVMAMLTDCIGFIPTVGSIWEDPSRENWKFWFSDVVSSSFSLLSLSVFTLETAAYPLYIFVLNGFAVGLILVRRRMLRSQ